MPLIANRKPTTTALLLDFYEIEEDVGFFTWLKGTDTQHVMERLQGQSLIIRQPSMTITLDYRGKDVDKVRFNTRFKQNSDVGRSGSGRAWKATEYLSYTNQPSWPNGNQFERTANYRENPAFVRRILAFLANPAERVASTLSNPVLAEMGYEMPTIDDGQWLRVMMVVCEAFPDVDAPPEATTTPEMLLQQLQYAAGALGNKVSGSAAVYETLKQKWNELPRTRIEELRKKLGNDRPPGYEGQRWDRFWIKASGNLRRDMAAKLHLLKRVGERFGGSAEDALRTGPFGPGTFVDFTTNVRPYAILHYG